MDTIKKHTFSRRKKEMIFYVLMLIYPIVQFLVFYVYVHLDSILLAFQRYDTTDPMHSKYVFNGLETLKLAFEDLKNVFRLKEALKNSLIAFFVSLLPITFALFFAYYIFKKKFLSSTFRVFLYVPMIISPLVLVVLFHYFIGSAIPELFLKYFKIAIPDVFQKPYAFNTMLIYTVLIGFGSNVLMFLSTMSSIDDSVLEAADIDGASGFQVFYYIVFKHTYSVVVTFVIVAISQFFTNQLNLYSFYGTDADYSLYTYGYYVFVQTSKATFNEYPYISALGLIFTCIAVPTVLVVRKLLVKFGPSED